MNGIANPAKEYFKDGQWGWDGSVWRKLNLLFGYHAPYSESIAVNNVAAATYVMEFSVVPAGEIWIVTAAAGFCVQDLADGISFSPTVGGTLVTIKKDVPTTASNTLDWTGWITLQEDDFCAFYFTNCALNNDVRGSVTGYKMLIAE